MAANSLLYGNYPYIQLGSLLTRLKISDRSPALVIVIFCLGIN